MLRVRCPDKAVSSVSLAGLLQARGKAREEPRCSEQNKLTESLPENCSNFPSTVPSTNNLELELII